MSESITSFDTTIVAYDGDGSPLSGAVVYYRLVGMPGGSGVILANEEIEAEGDIEGEVTLTLIDGATYSIRAGNGRAIQFIASQGSTSGSIPVVVSA